MPKVQKIKKGYTPEEGSVYEGKQQLTDAQSARLDALAPMLDRPRRIKNRVAQFRERADLEEAKLPEAEAASLKMTNEYALKGSGLALKSIDEVVVEDGEVKAITVTT